MDVWRCADGLLLEYNARNTQCCYVNRMYAKTMDDYNDDDATFNSALCITPRSANPR